MKRKPANVMRQQSEELKTLARDMGIELPPGYELFVTATGRGRCNYEHQTITVPQWAFNTLKTHKRFHKGNDRYREYYLAHECAHAFTFEATGERQHRGDFMKHFMRLCPRDLWHFELNYKPGLARAAGIKAR